MVEDLKEIEFDFVQINEFNLFNIKSRKISRFLTYRGGEFMNKSL